LIRTKQWQQIGPFCFIVSRKQMEVVILRKVGDHFLQPIPVSVFNFKITQNAFTEININPCFQTFFLLILFADPLVDPIKDDPRYQKIRKIIFPETKEIETPKAKKTLLDDQTANRYANYLMEFIKKEEPYLDPTLSLRFLAEKTDIQPNQLSWLLNEKFGKNFNDFINHFRVQTFKKLAKDTKNKHLTLMALAYDSGFNSKTVFNTYFKKETGLTPKEFVKGD